MQWKSLISKYNGEMGYISGTVSVTSSWTISLQ